MSKQSLLLVDGDTRSLRVLEVSLRKAGFTVTAAPTVQDALDKLELHTPDLIISETTFAEGDGFELRRRVRARADLAEIPFIFLTAEAAIENKIRGLELGVDDYLTKPIYIKEIVTRINILLQKRQRAKFEERKDGRTRFTGRVADMPVVDVIQTIEISRKSGVIQFVSERGGHAAIYFRDGKVIDAEAGTLQGEDAVYRLLTWSDGEFEVVFRTVRRREQITTSSQGLLMEGMRRLDEWSRLLEQLPPLSHRFEVDTAELAARLGDVPDDNNRILRLIDGKRTLLEVIDASSFGDLECLQAISRLFFEGLVIDLDPELVARRDTGKPMPLVEIDDADLDADLAAAPSEALGQRARARAGRGSSAPSAQMAGARPSSLRLIDEAVAAAQAIDPFLFDDASPESRAGTSGEGGSLASGASTSGEGGSLASGASTSAGATSSVSAGPGAGTSAPVGSAESRTRTRSTPPPVRIPDKEPEPTPPTAVASAGPGAAPAGGISTGAGSGRAASAEPAAGGPGPAAVVIPPTTTGKIPAAAAQPATPAATSADPGSPAPAAWLAAGMAAGLATPGARVTPASAPMATPPPATATIATPSPTSRGIVSPPMASAERVTSTPVGAAPSGSADGASAVASWLAQGMAASAPADPSPAERSAAVVRSSAAAADNSVPVEILDEQPATPRVTRKRATAPPPIPVPRAIDPDSARVRMIGSLGRDRYETSGEVSARVGAVPAAQPTQRELVTILPRRITREIQGVAPASTADVQAPPLSRVPTHRISQGTGVVRLSRGPGAAAIGLFALAGVLALLALVLYMRGESRRSAARAATASVEAGAPLVDASGAGALPDASGAGALPDAGPSAQPDATLNAFVTDAGASAAPAPVDAALDPFAQAKAYAGAAAAALKQRDPARALELADASLQHRRTARGYLARAQALHQLRRINEALAAIAAAERLAPELATVWEVRGSILWTARRWDDAHDAYNRFLELEQDTPRAERVRRRLAEPH